MVNSKPLTMSLPKNVGLVKAVITVRINIPDAEGRGWLDGHLYSVISNPDVDPQGSSEPCGVI